MVRFYLGEGNLYHVQSLLDKWSASHPEASLDDIDMDYTIDKDGNWHIILAHQEDE